MHKRKSNSNSKSLEIKKLLRKDIPVKVIAQKLNISLNYIYIVKRQLQMQMKGIQSVDFVPASPPTDPLMMPVLTEIKRRGRPPSVKIAEPAPVQPPEGLLIKFWKWLTLLAKAK